MTISSNAQTVLFYNLDGLHVTADFPGNSAMNPKTGDLWYGGPDSGDFTIGAVPITYSGGAAAESVTLRSVCGGDAMTDDEAPYEFTLDCEAEWTSRPHLLDRGWRGSATESGACELEHLPAQSGLCRPTRAAFQRRPQRP